MHLRRLSMYRPFWIGLRLLLYFRYFYESAFYFQPSVLLSFSIYSIAILRKYFIINRHLKACFHESDAFPECKSHRVKLTKKNPDDDVRSKGPCFSMPSLKTAGLHSCQLSRVLHPKSCPVPFAGRCTARR